MHMTHTMSEEFNDLVLCALLQIQEQIVEVVTLSGFSSSWR